MGRSKRRILVPTSSIGTNSLVHMRVNGIVPFSKGITTKRTVIGRASLANRSTPMHGTRNDFTCTKAILRRNRLAIGIGRTTNSDHCRGVIGVVRSSRGLGSSIRDGTRRLTSELMPCALTNAKVACLLAEGVAGALTMLVMSFSYTLGLTVPISMLSTVHRTDARDVAMGNNGCVRTVTSTAAVMFSGANALAGTGPMISSIMSFDRRLDSSRLLHVTTYVRRRFPRSVTETIIGTTGRGRLIRRRVRSGMRCVMTRNVSAAVRNGGTIVKD